MKALSSFLALTLVAFAADAPPPKAEEVAKSYKTLELLTPKPIRNPDPSFYRSLTPSFYTNLCIPPPATGQVVQPKRLLIEGPHISHVNHYRNLLAQLPGEKSFVAGSVLVKEKLTDDAHLPAASIRDPQIPNRAPGADEPKSKVTALAGMIKRPAGTLPKSGDWEFFWFENGKLTTSGLESCAGCHSGAKKDYVFTDFSKK